MIILDSTICGQFATAASREWLETNGLGGFASGTVSGANTRRYHGVFTPATAPPLGRITMVSKLEETVFIAGKSYELSANQFPGQVHPQGFRLIRTFRLDPFPIWEFDLDGLVIEKKIFMPHGQNATVCRWQVHRKRGDKRPIVIEIKPLLSFVDYHHLRHESQEFDGSYTETDGVVSMRPQPEMPAVFFHRSAGTVISTGYWYRDFEYAIELERGFDHTEDLYQPFAIRIDDVPAVSVAVSTDSDATFDWAKLEHSEVRRRNALIRQAKATTDLARQLVLAADQFVVARGNGHTVIAGYPWFSDWGRDTMISLAGLTLATNRTEIARNILLEFSEHISRGMLPNRFPDAGSEAEYNTVDATLWYFEAVRAYAAKTADYEFVRDELYEKLVEIVAWHLKGTRYGIHVDTDGLLQGGEPGVQLTWMDAKIGDWVVTPRTGKPVEIQALWYNSLRIMADLAERFGDLEDRSKYVAMADLAKLSFSALFWNEGESCLYDVIDNGARDSSVRPNQILAVSLPHSMVDDAQARQIVDKVAAELLTPLGLRSLSPKNSRYIPTYIGSPLERDSAYHQGTVWGWLIGPFLEAYLKVYPDRKDQITDVLSGFGGHLTESGIGQISEIFDGDFPHAPRGCPAQAWSVAEVLRIMATSEKW